MASSGAMADFARMPPQRQALVFVVIGALAALLYWKFVYKSLDDDLEAAQSEHDQKVVRNRQLADDIPRYAELRAHMATIRALIEKNQTALPSEAELPAFFETLQHKIAESGVEMRKWANHPEESVESFMRVPVEIEISGTFMQIKRFFASLIQADVRPSPTAEDRGTEERERIVSIENLALTNPTVKNREIVLDAKFTAVTFRQEDKQAPADKQAGGKPAPAGSASRPPPPSSAPASPSAASGAPPPLPSAASPAGARARTERALEKGDARNRNAAGVDEAKSPAAGSDRLKGGL
ncbi:MAG TPA: type 4a pilus biogenesis protein PilO [Kofleriaceae bacterium]|nr:type 4a pilus biogenesis protein PilO [Kofleriaceae bacterium]